MLRIILLCLFACPAVAQTVSTPAALQKALQRAEPGAVITLTAGDYGALQWRGARGVTLRGPGVFSGLDLQEAQDLRFEGVRFIYQATAGAPDHARPFVVSASQSVIFENVIFQSGGQIAHPTGYGVFITQSANVALQKSLVTGFMRGLIAQDSQNITVLDSELTRLRSDGLNFAGCQGVIIARNKIHNFTRDPAAGDHADMIQFWTRGTTHPSTDIQIIGNILDVGQGLWTQSVFMRNEAAEAGQAGMAYRNIEIRDNLIVNAHLHGITVGETIGLAILSNTVVQARGAAGAAQNPGLWTPQIRVAETAEDVRINQNVTAKITGFQGQDDWQVAGNLLVQNQHANKAGYYAQVFGQGALAARPDPKVFLLPDQNVGATATD